MKKIGIMGGTFNPVHNGHLFLAESAWEQAELDKIVFMPTKNPPHKDNREIISQQHRMEMVRLAIEGNPHFELSAMELEREGVTYTADTLSILTKENPDTKYYFIIGADSLFMMQEWHTPRAIFNLSTILVAGRDRVPAKQMNGQIKLFEDAYDANIILLDMPAIELSSVAIRKRVSENKTIRYYVPDKVMDYIRKNELYITED